MNKDYLKEFYAAYKQTFEDYELDINSLDDLVDYLCSTIKSNLQYDFGIDLDTDKLFNLNTRDKNNINHIEIETEEMEK